MDGDISTGKMASPACAMAPLDSMEVLDLLFDGQDGILRNVDLAESWILTREEQDTPPGSGPGSANVAARCHPSKQGEGPCPSYLPSTACPEPPRTQVHESSVAIDL
ncbi:rCG29236, isoform CRA_b, partial [Rattus norvegicus]